MAAQAPSIEIPSTTFTWKKDSSAGDIPAEVYYGRKAAEEGPHPISWVLGSADIIPKTQIINLITKGFVVVTPEYRLCPQVAAYEGPVQDAKDLLAWCQEKLPSLLKEAAGVRADGKKVVSMGHSGGAHLALITGLCPNPPVAIIDFYGSKYLRDYTYQQPFLGFGQIPDMPEEFINKIYEGPTEITSRPMSVNGKPNLEDPRSAWFITQAKNGTSVSACFPDGDYERVEATNGFSKNYPPTFFLHGTIDKFVDYKLTVRAHEQLKTLGVETELLLGDDIDHAFDMFITDQDPKFARYVVPAFEFAHKHV